MYDNEYNLNCVAGALKKCARAVVVSHDSPDGDAYGCSIGLCLAMRASGRNAVFIVSGKIPGEYDFLETSGITTSAENYRRKPGDVLFVLDCGDISRIQKDAAAAIAGLPMYCVDHHKSNMGFGLGAYIDPKASSTSELILRISEKLGFRLTRGAAEALWAGIVTDTGRFSYSNTSPETLCAAARLVSAGVRIETVNSHIYEMMRLCRLRLMHRLLATLDVFAGGRAAIVSLSSDDYSEEGCDADDSENFVDVARAIRGVEIAAFVRQPHKSGPVFVSMRTRGPHDAAEICSAWGGGGHARAAGASLPDVSLSEMMDSVRSAMRAAAETRPQERPHIPAGKDDSPTTVAGKSI